MSDTHIPRGYRILPFILQTLAWFPTRLALAVFGRFRIYGRENLHGLSQAIFAVNHSNESDPILLTAATGPFSHFWPMFYIMVPPKELHDMHTEWMYQHIYRKPFFRAWGSYELVRGMRDYDKSLSAHVHLLQKGASLCVFPEGGISKDGALREPKGGIIHLARETGVPIVPVALDGTYKLTPKLFFGRKRRFTLEFGSPVYADDIVATKPAEYHQEAVRVFARVATMLDKRRAAAKSDGQTSSVAMRPATVPVKEEAGDTNT